ncbi:sensor domain-containing diguanylate cyclase [Sphingopyxis alaskensis]|jgi:diguanylate cyclase (GGDEF)-like protein/PAS domain S-box-containing protein|uniref:diguanylate cyclase n=1 Tax=Sphingopyxis alaskensis (strain DSM 13593 / LMG 18877 / RB2256) TaxID=317655 RepID=Q1GSG4_SPHAL|nr:sensor domain-containing diguanylate cyclase [Sphingopyxis alaskensis]ABF53408.1 diguanylate cyclase with PAS/PAC sensor [Sphingopyxis alaskensis RB2256]
MIRSLSPRVEAVFWFLLTVTGYYLLASLSLYATRGADNIAAVWPASGYILALLLLMPARGRVPAFAGMAVASIAANMGATTPFWTSLSFTFANMVEAIIALWLIRRHEPGELSFMAPRAVIHFCVAAVAASLVGAGLATLLAGRGGDFFLSWATTVLLGMLIVTPPIVMLTRMMELKAFGKVPRAMLVEATAILTGAGAVTILVFSQSHFPATFLPSIAVVAAAYRLGPFGAAAGMLIVTIIASLLSGQGYGPMAAIDSDPKVKVLFLQFYLLSLLLAALPLAALLIGRQRLARRLEQSNRWLLQAEAAALVGHWRVNLVDWTIYWSDQTYRIHGLEPGTPVDVDYSVRQYLAEDRAAVQRVLEEAVRSGEPFEFHGRILRADGQVRHVKSHGSIERGRGGGATGIFGTVQDVTETVENARILEAARSAAERVANTDMLTGLPNRRHTLTFLEEAMAGARAHGAPLAVAIFDIDHFKRINDTHGHATGDQVIQRVAQRARSVLRDEDMIGRIGGEEFVCILQRASALSGEIVAERVRKAVENGVGQGDGLPPTTVSIGLAVYDGEQDIEELLHRADQALYAAKREGRNRMRRAA